MSDSSAEESEDESSPVVPRAKAATGSRRPPVHPSKVSAKQSDISTSPTKVALSSPGRRAVGQPAIAGSLLFSLLKKPVIRAENVEAWISLFRTDRVAAVSDLVNFVLACAGATKNWIQRDVDLEALEPEV